MAIREKKSTAPRAATASEATAESFKGAAHLDALVREARKLVNTAIGAA